MRYLIPLSASFVLAACSAESGPSSQEFASSSASLPPADAQNDTAAVPKFYSEAQAARAKYYWNDGDGKDRGWAATQQP